MGGAKRNGHGALSPDARQAPFEAVAGEAASAPARVWCEAPARGPSGAPATPGRA